MTKARGWPLRFRCRSKRPRAYGRLRFQNRATVSFSGRFFVRRSFCRRRRRAGLFRVRGGLPLEAESPFGVGRMLAAPDRLFELSAAGQVLEIRAHLAARAGAGTIRPISGADACSDAERDSL